MTSEFPSGRLPALLGGCAILLLQLGDARRRIRKRWEGA
jgi:hypothetical protein